MMPEYNVRFDRIKESNLTKKSQQVPRKDLTEDVLKMFLDLMRFSEMDNCQSKKTHVTTIQIRDCRYKR